MYIYISVTFCKRIKKYNFIILFVNTRKCFCWRLEVTIINALHSSAHSVVCIYGLIKTLSALTLKSLIQQAHLVRRGIRVRVCRIITHRQTTSKSHNIYLLCIKRNRPRSFEQQTVIIKEPQGNPPRVSQWTRPVKSGIPNVPIICLGVKCTGHRKFNELSRCWTRQKLGNLVIYWKLQVICCSLKMKAVY